MLEEENEKIFTLNSFRRWRYWRQKSKGTFSHHLDLSYLTVKIKILKQSLMNKNHYLFLPLVNRYLLKSHL